MKTGEVEITVPREVVDMAIQSRQKVSMQCKYGPLKEKQLQDSERMQYQIGQMIADLILRAYEKQN